MYKRQDLVREVVFGGVGDGVEVAACGRAEQQASFVGLAEQGGGGGGRLVVSDDGLEELDGAGGLEQAGIDRRDVGLSGPVLFRGWVLSGSLANGREVARAPSFGGVGMSMESLDADQERVLSSVEGALPFDCLLYTSRCV